MREPRGAGHRSFAAPCNESEKAMNYFDVQNARAAFLRGENVTDLLRSEVGSEVNTSDIIEIAYDLQAGSYIRATRLNMKHVQAYVEEIAELIAPYLTKDASLLDVGTGELTTFSLLVSQDAIKPKTAFAFDISWSRLHHGVQFWAETVKDGAPNLVPFVADLREIPLASNSIDIVTSSHALEPNGGAIDHILSELFRICRNRLVLFEPSYELNSLEGKSRMDNLGYIKDLEGSVRRLGGELEKAVSIKNISNPLNPTMCYVVKAPEIAILSDENEFTFTVPGTDFPLRKRDGFYVSENTGLVFPELEGIPILKSNAGILASSFANQTP